MSHCEVTRKPRDGTQYVKSCVNQILQFQRGVGCTVKVKCIHDIRAKLSANGLNIYKNDFHAPSPSHKPCSGTHPNLVHHYLCCKWLKERLSTRAKNLVRHSVPCATEVQTKLGRESPRQYLNLQRRVWISAPTASGKCTAHNLLRAPMHRNGDQIGTQQNQTWPRSTTALRWVRICSPTASGIAFRIKDQVH